MRPHQIEQALKKKGFRFESDKKKHKHYVLYYKNKPTAVHTKISHNNHELGIDLEKDMADQMSISLYHFREFVSCTLGEDEYTQLLVNKRVIG